MEEKLPIPQYETVKALVNGWETAENGSHNMQFLAALRRPEVDDPSLLFLETAPISKKRLPFAKLNLSDQAKEGYLGIYRESLREPALVDQWVFLFSAAANLSCFGITAEELLREYERLLSHYEPYFERIDVITALRLQQVQREILSLDPNWVFLDYTTPAEDIIIPPLADSEKDYFATLAEMLNTSKIALALYQTPTEALKAIRFALCASGNSFKGYSTYDRIAAGQLIGQGVFGFKPQSTYIITEWFNLLCYNGYPSQALGHFLEYQTVLMRPDQFPFTLPPRYPRTYLEFVRRPSRLCRGLAEALNQGHISVLKAFFDDAATRPLIDSREFYLQLSHFLSTKALFLVKSFFAQFSKIDCRDDYGLILPEQAPKQDIIPESVIITSLDASRYYDDRNVLRFLLSSTEPAHQRQHRYIVSLYNNDIEFAISAVKANPDNISNISSKVKVNPDFVDAVGYLDEGLPF